MRTVIGILVGCGVSVLLQWLFFGRLELWGAYPDIVLLYVAVVALQHGRLGGALTGFATGFLLDAIYGSWGIQMFVKTMIGFLVGLFASEERWVLTSSTLQVPIVALVVALVHNGILLLLVLLQSGVRSSSQVTELWIGCTVYTALLAFVISLVRRQ